MFLLLLCWVGLVWRVCWLAVTGAACGNEQVGSKQCKGCHRGLLVQQVLSTAALGREGTKVVVQFYDVATESV